MMKKYVIKRTLRLLTTFIGAIIIIYFIFLAVPGNFIDGIMDPHLTQQTIDQLNDKYHFNKPKTVQFLYWLKGAAHGDLGSMYAQRFNAKPVPVSMIVKFSAISTLKIMFITMFIGVLIAIPLSLKAASRAGQKKEKIIKGLSLLGTSLPAFIIALTLLNLIKNNSFVLNHFFSSKNYDGYTKFVNFLVISVIPFLVLTLIYIANIVSYGHACFVEILKSEYIKCAAAMGIKEKKILYKYTLKNGLINIVTILGACFPVMFGEVLVVESAIGRPGLGSLMLNAVRQRQYNISMAIILVSTIIILLCNYLVDMSYIIIDPRVKFDYKKS